MSPHEEKEERERKVRLDMERNVVSLFFGFGGLVCGSEENGEIGVFKRRRERWPCW